MFHLFYGQIACNGNSNYPKTWVGVRVCVCVWLHFISLRQPFIKCRNTFSHIFLIFAPCWRRLRFSEFYSDFCSHSLSPSLPLPLTFSLTNCNMHVNADVSNVSRHLAHCKFVLCVTTRHAGCSLSFSHSYYPTVSLSPSAGHSLVDIALCCACKIWQAMTKTLALSLSFSLPLSVQGSGRVRGQKPNSFSAKWTFLIPWNLRPRRKPYQLIPSLSLSTVLQD